MLPWQSISFNFLSQLRIPVSHLKKEAIQRSTFICINTTHKLRKTLDHDAHQSLRILNHGAYYLLWISGLQNAAKCNLLTYRDHKRVGNHWIANNINELIRIIQLSQRISWSTHTLSFLSLSNFILRCSVERGITKINLSSQIIIITIIVYRPQKVYRSATNREHFLLSMWFAYICTFIGHHDGSMLSIFLIFH